MPFLRLPSLPGVFLDDTPLSQEGHFSDSNWVRFERGRPQTKAGYEHASESSFSGICRGMHAWSDNVGIKYASIGTHLRHYAFYGGDSLIYENTPVTSRATLTNALTTASGRATVTVTWATHGLIDNQRVGFANASSLGGITIDGDYSIDVTATNTFLIVHSTIAASTVAAGGGSPDVTVYLAPGEVDGAGSLGFGTGPYGSGGYGQQSDIDYFPRTWSESNWGQNSLSMPRGGSIYEWSPLTAATELVTNGDMATSTGWTSGTGWLIAGGVATASVGSASDLTTTITMTGGAYFLLSFDLVVSAGTLTAAIGSTNILSVQTASARVQQTFFTGVGALKFEKSTTFAGTVDNVSVKQLTTAQLLPNAPTTNTVMVVTPEKIAMVAGTIDSNSGSFNPMHLRWSDSDISVATGLPGSQQWTPAADNQAGFYTLGVGSRILALKNGRGEVLCWTDSALYAGRYIPDPNIVYSWTLIGTGCGVIGPNSPVMLNGVAYWMTPAGEFKAYAGGTVVDLDSTLSRDLGDNLAAVQGDKVYGFSTSEHQEVGWNYADDRDGTECSRFVDYKTNGQQFNIWTPNSIARTAWLDAGLFPFPLATGTDGRLYFMEKGASANGGALVWSLRRASFDLADGTNLFQANAYIPDFDDLQGNVSLDIGTYEYPGAPRVSNTGLTVSNTTEKLDLAPVTGRQMDIQYSGNTAPTFARWGLDALDVIDTGMGW